MSDELRDQIAKRLAAHDNERRDEWTSEHECPWEMDEMGWGEYADVVLPLVVSRSEYERAEARADAWRVLCGRLVYGPTWDSDGIEGAFTLEDARIATEGGCGCSPPYDECPHGEPLTSLARRYEGYWQTVCRSLATVEGIVQRLLDGHEPVLLEGDWYWRRHLSGGDELTAMSPAEAAWFTEHQKVNGG